MHARLTSFQSNDIDAMVAMIPDIKGKLAAIPGMVRSQVAWNADGSGVSMTVYESTAAAEAAGPTIMEIWGGMAQYLAAPPEASDFTSADTMV